MPRECLLTLTPSAEISCHCTNMCHVVMSAEAFATQACPGYLHLLLPLPSRLGVPRAVQVQLSWAYSRSDSFVGKAVKEAILV